MKNSGVLCLIHDVTACFTSSYEVKWVPLRSLLRWGKKWKSLGPKSGLQGGWEKTSNFSVSRASIVARAVCGLALSCSNKIGDVDRLTQHTLRLGFLLSQCTELNWQYSQLPKILSCKLFVSPKKQSKESCRQTALFKIFFGRGDEVCLYCMLSCSSSGSKWWIHDSFPVTIFKRNW